MMDGADANALFGDRTGTQTPDKEEEVARYNVEAREMVRKMDILVGMSSSIRRWYMYLAMYPKLAILWGSNKAEALD